MGLYDELANLEKPASSYKGAPTPSSVEPPEKPQSRPIRKSADQLANQSTNQSTGQSTDPLVEIERIGPIVERPRAFYITQSLDQWLDKAVRRIQGTGLHKMDRSVLINGLLHDPEVFKDQNLLSLRKRFLAHLTNKSIKRGQPADE